MAGGWNYKPAIALLAILACAAIGRADAPPAPPPISSESDRSGVPPAEADEGIYPPGSVSRPNDLTSALTPLGAAPFEPVAPAPYSPNPAWASPVPPPVPYYSQLFNQPAVPPSFDPLLENRGFSLGWFAKAEVDAVYPHIHSGVNSNFAVPGVFASTVNTPIAQPGLSAMPRFELAYRFGQGMGELVTSFRFLSAQGSGTDATFDSAGAGRIASRLNLDTLDFDYAATEFIPVRFPRIIPLFLIPGWLGMNSHPEHDPNPAPLVMRWMAGARLANVNFNSQGSGAVVLNDRIMNNFVGAGLHTSAEFTKAMPWKPLSFFAKFDASGILGDASQSFTQTTLLGGTTSAALRDITTGVPVFQFQGGITWVPEWHNRRCRVTTGYQYEQWWYLGQTTGSTAGLTLQGMFFRGEWGY